LFAVLSCAAVATSLRLHLWFTARFSHADLAVQRTRTSRWIGWCDVGFAGCLLAAAVTIGSAHPEFAILLITVALALAVSSRVIEPATTTAAFREER